MEQQEVRHNTRKSNNKKTNFFTFKGLGCTAPAQVSVPTMIRSSASWEGKKVREKKVVTPVRDVWCGPGSGLSTDVDCVVSSRRNTNNNNNTNNVVVVSGRAKIDVEKINNRGSCSGRRMVHPEEDLPFFDTDTRIPHEHRLHVFGSRHHRHLRHRTPHGLSEIVTLQGNLLMGGRLDHDQYRDWRLDVDNMSYEELLDLGDKIGYVCTGLREDEIHRCVRKAKPPVVSEDKSSSRIPTEMQWKCTVCQEEYEEEDEIGKLDCGHFYHMYCIKQWLAQKKTCPICKAEAAVKSQQQAG
ncbi:RING/U-box superfamily protein [Artemisia annua]|uniref:RING-type E3 ubiquitin transferase n=1 Tax=Artemisia annua TaxID=35608 RepID=A0A2U1NS63_ARTAN|nr:RING/U-box superfamily protein [Artemisia annua]